MPSFYLIVKMYEVDIKGTIFMVISFKNIIFAVFQEKLLSRRSIEAQKVFFKSLKHLQQFGNFFLV